MSSTAFGISAEDVETVLCLNRMQLPKLKVSSTAAAERIFDDFDSETFHRIEQAALNSGVDLDIQTEGAYGEIRAVVLELFANGMPDWNQ